MSTKQAAVKEPPADTTAEPKRYPSIGELLDARLPGAFGPSPDYEVQFTAWWDAIGAQDQDASKALEGAITEATKDLDDHYERELVQVHSGTKVTVAEVPVHHEVS